MKNQRVTVGEFMQNSLDEIKELVTTKDITVRVRKSKTKGFKAFYQVRFPHRSWLIAEKSAPSPLSALRQAQEALKKQIEKVKNKEKKKRRLNRKVIEFAA